MATHSSVLAWRIQGMGEPGGLPSISASQAHGSQERTWGKDHFHPSIPSDWGFRGSLAGKESACKAGDLGSIPGLGRFPGEGNGNLLQYSGLENSMDRGAWWVTVHEVTELDTTERGFPHTARRGA